MENILNEPVKKVKLATRKDLHIARKLWHILGVGFILWLYITLPYKVVLGLGSLVTALVIILDYLRLQFAFFQKVVVFIMKPFMREEEKRNLTGLSFMCIGFWALILLFPRDIVMLTILFVMFGDPIASWFGSKYGKDKIGDKSVQGFIACFVTCTVIAGGYLIYSDFLPERLIYATLLAGLIGGISELIQVPKLDDNLTMPLISASLLTALFNLIS